jgi:hypothetical protein
MLIISRSIAIDHLKDRITTHEKRVVYVYFDSKARQIRTDMDVAKILLKQLLSQSGTTPTNLETLYVNFILTSTEPDICGFIELLALYSQRFRIYAIFDGIDECSDIHQKCILSLLARLQELGYRLLISTRPHVHLQDQLSSTQTFEVSANEFDLKNYVMFRLRQERNSVPALQAKCLELIKNTHGM